MRDASWPVLHARDVAVRRGDVAIVEGFDWSHEPGTVAWLVGPNGAGKSSLMRVLAGVVAPHAGVVTREGSAAREGGEHDRVAYYHPSMSLPREPRARAFASLARTLVSGPHPLAPDRALGRKRCASLSTGEEKRLLLGPILARARPFVFLDEPYEHLSREAREELSAALNRCAATSVVVVATNQPLPNDAAGPVITLSLSEAAHVA